eukprot:scaffold127469_cov22-Tisochrysis_lutea.AAC.1
MMISDRGDLCRRRERARRICTQEGSGGEASRPRRENRSHLPFLQSILTYTRPPTTMAFIDLSAESPTDT